MNNFIQWISGLDWFIIIVLCLTLGLAPFNPPHIVEKIGMLLKGTLHRPMDWFDFILHGTPWIILMLKIFTTIKAKM